MSAAGVQTLAVYGLGDLATVLARNRNGDKAIERLVVEKDYP
jgi:hypothetical protein